MSSVGYCNHKSPYQKCVRALVKQTLDVQFIFENGKDAVKIPENKVVLAASSPVINAMVDGGLKEEGCIAGIISRVSQILL